LGGRLWLSAHQGMLFVYQTPARQCFWMKDMLFPIDIIWVNAQQTVVRVALQVRPESYPQTFCSDQPTMYGIELRAGEAERQGIRRGAHLSF